MQVLLDKGVDEGKILFLSIIAAPEGVHKICGQFPRSKVITTEIDEGIAPDFQVIPGKLCLSTFLLHRSGTMLSFKSASRLSCAHTCVCQLASELVVVQVLENLVIDISVTRASGAVWLNLTKWSG